MLTRQCSVDARSAPHDVTYAEHVNEQWVRLLDLMGMNVRYARCVGEELQAEDGTTYLDFLSGYGVYNVGHNHPRLIAALRTELEGVAPACSRATWPSSPAMSPPRCARRPGRLTRAFFTSTGSEGIETAIKFARAHTGRDRLLFASGAFHGLTCGAMSLMDTPFWTAGFGPRLPGTDAVPFGELAAVERALATERATQRWCSSRSRRRAASDCRGPGYLREVQALCARHGALLVVDEVQTGLCRTGSFLAAHQSGRRSRHGRAGQGPERWVHPGRRRPHDGGHPRSVYSSLDRAFVHASTFGENRLAMRAALTDAGDSRGGGPRGAVAAPRRRPSSRPWPRHWPPSRWSRRCAASGLFAGSPSDRRRAGRPARPVRALPERLTRLVRADGGETAVRAAPHPDPDLRQQLPGPQGRPAPRRATGQPGPIRLRHHARSWTTRTHRACSGQMPWRLPRERLAV